MKVYNCFINFQWIKICLGSWGILLLCLPTAAQQFRFQHLDMEDGLKSNKVLMSIADKEGFIWIATQNGVSKYDGRQLTAYDLEKVDSVQQRTNVNLLLDTDSKGQIWLVLSNGLVFKYDNDLDNFKHYDQILTSNKGKVYVGAFHIDHRDNFIIGSDNFAYLYTPSTRKTAPFPEVMSAVKSIIQSPDNTYFIGSRQGIFVYNDTLGLLYNLKEKEVQKSWIPDKQKMESLFFQASENKLWLGSAKSGLFYYDLTHHQLFSAGQKLGNIEVPIRSIADYGGGKLMVGTDGGGLFIYDTFTGKVVTQIVNEGGEDALSSNAIYDIFVCNQGVVFISTFRGGVNIYNPKKQHFSSFKHQKGNQNSLKNEVVYSIATPKKDLISFGTDMGISLLDKSSNTWQHLSLDPNDEENKSEVPWAQTVDKQGNLWVASFIYAPSQFQTKDGKNYHLAPTTLDSIKNARVKTIYQHPAGTLLLGSINKGLFGYHPAKNTKVYPIQEPNDMEAYGAKKVVITSRDGIALLDLEFEEVTWLKEGIFGNTLTNKAVVSCLVDANRHIWVGTIANGIYIFDLANNSVKSITTDNGLAANTIFDLINDAEGNIWVATSLGLSKIEQQKITNFYKSDGLMSTDFNRNTAILDKDGLLYFATNQGVITFDPSTIQASDIHKELVLTNFYLNHERINTGTNSIIKQAFNHTTSLALAPQQNSFSIGFTSIDFVHADQGEYFWKLEGYDQDWIKSYSQDRATYTNVPSGDYTFRLKMVNQLDQLIAPERRIQINIAKPFWKTTTAYVLYALFLSGVLAFILYAYRLWMDAKNSEERLHYLMEMAHEIKTPLTLIRAPITDILNKENTDEQSKESLTVALKNANKLHGQMMQFLDFKKTNLRKDSLTIHPFDLVQLIQTKIFAFKMLADRKQIQIKFQAPFKDFRIKSDAQILDKIISNLLSNAIKYTGQNGTIQLNLTADKQHWQLTVKDNGIGISKIDQKKIFTLFYRTKAAKETGSTGSGVGLVLASDLAKTLDGSVKLGNSTRQGSAFIITMPLLPLASIDLLALENPIEVLPDMDTPSINSEKVKILIVEDDLDLQQYQKQKLANKYHILTANNGESALKLAQSQLPDFILSDVNMPKMNGFQLCLHIKSDVATSHIPFILITGLGSKAHIQQGFESGADDYITKPYDFELLHAKIDNLINTRAAFNAKFITTEEEFDFQTINNKLDQQFINDITQLIEENISESTFSVNELCYAMGMSRTAFYHKLKALLAISPSEFIRTIRLKRAKKLLLNPNSSISEVAYSTGFSDAKYFSTIFKKYYGESPSGYVAGHRKSVK